jgi:arylsulfatase A-like enzyme
VTFSRRLALAAVTAALLASASVASPAASRDPRLATPRPVDHRDQNVSDASPASASSVRRSRPNIVFVVMDDLRRDDMAWLPAVQRRIVDRGTKFTNYYDPVSYCCPARASILRGQYPHNTGILTNAEPDGGFAGSRAIDSSTLATWLDPIYHTAYIGKYLNGYEGRDRTYVPPGWDEWMGTTKTYDYLGIHLNHNGTIVDHSGVNSPTLLAQQARQYIRARAPRRTPFYLQLSFVTPHEGGPNTDGDDAVNAPPGLGTPYVAPRARGTYNGPAHPANPSYNEADVSDKAGPNGALPSLSDRYQEWVAFASAQRRESLAAANRGITWVMKALRASGELRRTYVIFTSDNGYMLGEHRDVDKFGPYEPAAHLPLAMRGPGIRSGAKATGMAGTQDIAPTVLRMARARARADIPLDGHAVLPRRGWKEDPDRAIVIEKAALPVDGENGGKIRFAAPRTVAETDWAYRGLVTRRWKLISWDQLGTFEMYDLRKDPYELRSLYYSPKYHAKASALRHRLGRLWMCSAATCNR